ncbi:MAG: UDP-3-O-(3-hydroxymyristoyl)glucosamine N-acyltransferase [Pyrinomonadaceae bacterium]|nr:UDP-3-O-(3-hydroxymyristoyl)glucosamine N-acyltransferase [Pyrinomonadaceae bacterium]
MKLSELAILTGGTIETGNGDTEIMGAAGLDIAGPQDVTFIANPKYTPQIAATNAGAIFVAKEAQINREDIAVVRTDDAYVAYTMALRAFHPDPPVTSGIHPSAVIGENSKVADDAQIGANVVIGDSCEIESGVRLFPNVTVYDGVSIGKGTVLHSGVSIRENCQIGAKCIIHNNTTIGSDGFGFARTPEKKWLKIPQVGHVVIEDDVEIGSNSSIDCPSVGESRIKTGTRIDNLVQIGHSCSIGEDSLICAQTGLAGSSEIGDRVILAGQVGIAGHLKVGDDASITAKSATSHDVDEGAVVSGIPAFENRDWLRSTAAFRRIGEYAKIIRKLEKRVSELEEELKK